MSAPDLLPSAPTTPRRAVRGWDIALTVVLLLVLIAAAGLASFMGLFLVMASDSCGATVQCNSALIGTGFLVSTIGPWFVLVVAAVLGVLLMTTRRLAFWVPVAALLLIGAIWATGAGVVAAGVPGAL